MTKGFICMIALLLISSSLKAQGRTGAQIIRGGLVKIAIHSGPSYFFASSSVSTNVGGELEVYLSKRVSVRGDLSFNIPSAQSLKTVVHNHSLYWGFSYHMPYKKLDFLLGLQPGVSVVQGYKEDGSLTKIQAIPVITALGGCQIYFSRFFHCYVLARFVTGTYFSNAEKYLNMNELRFMVGAGFNINMVSLKKRPIEG